LNLSPKPVVPHRERGALELKAAWRLPPVRCCSDNLQTKLADKIFRKDPINIIANRLSHCSPTAYDYLKT
jgi:hypothetical protein